MPHRTSATSAARTCTAFAGTRRVLTGSMADVALAVKHLLDQGEGSTVLIFDDETSRPIEIDFRGTPEDVLKRVATEAGDLPGSGDGAESGLDGPRGPGRPRLGVVAREVTLLPRHWEWLGTQPGGASAVLRRLVDTARRDSVGKDRVRVARESAYRFMMAIAGNEPGFEEATRALFAGNAARFAECTASWPPDVRTHAERVSDGAFDTAAAAEETR
jgi:hypothetical protein